MIVMVTGGRDYTDYGFVQQVLAPWAAPGNILIAGGAWGADELARRVWHYDYQLPHVIVPAPWDIHQKAAGRIRNTQMIEGDAVAPYAKLVPDIVVAFPGGAGTTHAVAEAHRHGIQVAQWTW